MVRCLLVMGVEFGRRLKTTITPGSLGRSVRGTDKLALGGGCGRVSHVATWTFTTPLPLVLVGLTMLPLMSIFFR